jgi:transcriptional regulator with XRE-family HTH domain
MEKTALTHKVLAKAQRLFERSGMTLEELGLKMGYEPGTARRAAWQLFNKVGDLKLSSVEAMARALGVPPKDLL